MQQESGSRQRMIEATIELMRSSGLSGAGINEIVRASGAPKGSVYHFFPGGKQQIAAEALTAYSQRVMAFIDAALASQSRPSLKVRALFDAFARRVEGGQFRKSCAAGTVCLDLDADLDALRGVVAGAFEAWTEVIARHFAHGDGRAARSFAGLLLTAFEGAYIRARAERSSRPFKEAGTWLAELAATRFGDRPTARRRAL
ncbi:MAG TPA: TetR/AcrR family transcriptional regulator [Burkholderiaceae bacterium]|nr:TetR/AcrR family transcriptional regulator [Burkholderiaceae bacterium]